MKVFRFMSSEEFHKFLQGETLFNDKDHSEDYIYSHSNGFCFLDFDSYGLNYAHEFLFGIVSEDVLAVFEVTDSKLKLSINNKYADPCGDYFDTILVNEYCTESYNNKDFKLIGHLNSPNPPYNYFNSDDLIEFYKKLKAEELRVRKPLTC